MSAILRTRLPGELSNMITVTLDEHPVTIPLSVPVVKISLTPSWWERLDTPCNRDPTVDIEPAVENSTPASPPQPEAAVPQSPWAQPAPASTENETPALQPPLFKVGQQAASDTTLLCGRYRIEQLIGLGGSAEIYRAKDLRRTDIASHSPAVATKVLKPEFREQPKSIERLKREYVHTLRLVHPNIVRVLDLDYCQHHGWFMTMELLDGESLAAVLRRRESTALPQRQSLSIIAACGRALSFAHEQGVLHCDFKPGNVQITHSARVCVLDFGAADVPQFGGGEMRRATATTPAYASPQLLAGDPVDERDDLFSLGCVAYELLAGCHPFNGLSATELKVAEPVLARPLALSSRRWQALRRSLSLNRDHRQKSIAVFLQEFGLTPRRDVRPDYLWLVASLVAITLIGIWMAWRSSPLQQRPDSSPRITQSAVPTPVTPAAMATVVKPAEGTALNSSSVNQIAWAPMAASSLTANAIATATASTAIVKNALPPSETKVLATRVTRDATASPRQLPAFGQAKFTVSSLAVAAALLVTRSDASDDQRIEWRTIDGSARAGIDYEPTTGAASFAKYQTTRMIYVGLKKNPEARRDRSFTVELRNPSPNGGKDIIARAEVTIRHAE